MTPPRNDALDRLLPVSITLTGKESDELEQSQRISKMGDKEFREHMERKIGHTLSLFMGAK